MSEFKRRLGLMIRSRWGLMLWALIWMGILLVPLWRLRATSQLQVLFTFLRNPQQTPAPSFENEVAQRYPNDASAQLAPLHPNFKQLPYLAQPLFGASLARRQAEHQKLAEKAAAYFARYDELERQFPDSNAVRAQRLRDVTEGSLIENEGPFAKDQKPYGGQPVWLSRLELEASLRTAQAGARHEPDNGFYPWMEATLWFSLNRPDEAIRALDRAGRCSRWSDDTFNTIRRRIELRSRVQPVAWESSSIELWVMLLPHFAKLRSTARAVAGQMRLAQQRGDEARALEIAGILQRAGAPMAHSQDTLISRLVGSAICAIAWKTATESLPPLPKPTSNQDARRQYLERFVAYTREHNRADLGQEAQRIFDNFDSLQLGKVYSSPGSDILTRYNNVISDASWLMFYCLCLAEAGALVWFVTWLLTRTKPKKDAARGVTLLYAFFCSGATAAILGFLTPWSTVIMINSFGENPTPVPPALGLLQNFLPLVLLALWTLPLAFSAFRLSSLKAWRLTRQRGKTDWRRFAFLGLWCLPGLFLVVLGYTSYSSASVLVPVVALGLVLASAYWVTSPSEEKNLSRVLTYAACWLTALAFIVVVIMHNNAVYALLLGALALGAAVMARATGNPRERSPAFQNLAYRTRLTAAVLSLGATLGYAGTTLWLAPIESRAQALFQRQLQIGEAAFLREQLNQPK